MARIILSALEEGRYSISGDTSSILSNKRAKMLLRSRFPFQVENDIITFNSDWDVPSIYEVLKQTAKYAKCEISLDGETSNSIREFEDEENSFAEFSHLANSIKLNECPASNLQEFASSVSANMTNRRLYPLQLLSAYHLAFSQNGCNFSVPGAGKTSIVYGAYTYLKHTDDPTKKVDKLLIVGPLSSFGPWENEFEECFGRKPNVKRISGGISAEEKQQYFYGNVAELVLISYSSLASITEAVKYYLSQNRVMVVLDEAHKIKNTNGGITAQSILSLSPFCKSRVILTGTPAPNGYEDLYNLFHFIWPNHDVLRYNVGQLRDMSRSVQDSRVPALMNNLNPYFIRIKKSDLGIPAPINHDPILVPMSDRQRAIYDFIEQQLVDEATSSTNRDVHSLLVKAKMIRLQQSATNPALLNRSLSEFNSNSDNFDDVEDADASIISEISNFISDEIPNKYIICADLIEDIIRQGGKVVVWAIFIQTIESLQAYLQSRGIGVRTLYGATPIAKDGMSEDDAAFSETREAIIKEFHRPDSSFNVIIANPFAVAESISLHKACHNAIYIERSFNCAHFVQSKDRIHRYGLQQGVDTHYYYLLSENSVDETIHRRLNVKETRMVEILESSPIPLFNALDENSSDEDIKAIINDYVKRKAQKI